MPETRDYMSQTQSEYEAFGTSRGLFGETDRTSGEYRFKSGYTQQVYSNARYSPADETVPPRYYKPNGEAEAAVPKDYEKKKKRRGGLITVILLCLGCAVAGCAVGVGIVSAKLSERVDQLEERVYLENETDEAEEALSSETEIMLADIGGIELASESAAEPLTVQQVYEKACSEVVSINTEYAYTDRYGYTIPSVVSGTGVVISEDGYILTNYHVIEKAAEGGFNVAVTLYDGTSHIGTYVGGDKINDIAVIHINCSDLSPAAIGESKSLCVGDEIYAVGNPFGILDFTMTAGHVSALDRLIATQTNENNAARMFQIDAAVFEGNSGGPVYNKFGEVVGIVAAKYSPEIQTEGIGFAIPINTAMNAASKILGTGFEQRNSTAVLGVLFDERYTSMAAYYYGLPTGAYIYSVNAGSCAERAGLLPGDIITQIGQIEISECKDVPFVLKRFNSGEGTTLVIYRDGQAYVAEVTFD